jgi:hypothetical protein
MLETNRTPVISTRKMPAKFAPGETGWRNETRTVFQPD